jgi:hypothetical protein
VSCARKRELYLLSRNIDDLELTRYYKKYCKVLTEVIKLAKHCYYNKLISNSKNKIKTSWSIIRSVTDTNSEKNPILIINIKGKLCNNAQIMANFINNYLASPLPQMKASISTNGHEALKFLSDVFKHPFPSIYMTLVTNKEIKDIVKSLKLKYS